MKKILAALLVLALAIPAMAAVDVTATDLGGGHLQIKVAPTAGAAVRGVALKLTRTDGDAAISGTDKATATQFNVFIDYAFSVPAGFTVTPIVGHPLAKASTPGVLETFPASEFVLCGGYLDESGGKAGLVVDSFFDVFYTLTTASTITIELDTLRGGIVGDTLGTVTVASPATLVVAPVPCNVSKPTIAKTTAAPAVAGLVNGGRVETFVASAASDQSHGLQYQFTWGDGVVGDWGADTQTYTYTYAAAATYNVTVQARCTVDGALSVASDALVEASEAVKSTAAFYTTWATTFSRPNCWAFKRNCRGDVNGTKTGLSNIVWVGSADLTIFAAAFNQYEPALKLIVSGGFPGICADNNRAKTGLSNIVWVGSADLTVFASYFNKYEPLVPVCDQTNYWYWTN